MTDLLDRPTAPDSPSEPEAGRTTDIRDLSVRAALGGALIMLSGVVLDVAGASTAGRVVPLVGGVVLVAALLLAAFGPALYGGGEAVTSGRRIARVVAPVAVVAVLGALAVWAAGAGAAGDEGAGEGHDHPAVPDQQAGAPMPAQPAGGHTHEPGSEATGTGGVVHGDGPAVPLDAATQKELTAQMATTREATMRYPTVADAEAAGLRKVGLYAPGSGAHYYQPPPPPGFDPAAPTMWIYAGNEPTSPVVGVMFYSMSAEAPPEGFAGPNDHWHQHNGLCLKNLPDGIDLPLPVDRDVTREQCDGVGGRFLDITGWMIHVWSAPGWESPEGAFSHDHKLLVCSDGKTAEEAELHVGCQGMA